jgi:hypothetical protein
VGSRPVTLSGTTKLKPPSSTGIVSQVQLSPSVEHRTNAISAMCRYGENVHSLLRKWIAEVHSVIRRPFSRRGSGGRDSE